ncbi:type II toxin-antitoxin system Phd/YefM family antitoxin [Glycomyces sp. YM15]|uniref:type II toxin-antitoxin system Phd/YefM family antitoxin n=1 Tax=Glycomyces sp. YM15 TaxID=2800446 RepID=UPI00196540BA|nr:type II toxin-antitoxin system Phd/YefM family antitoxin [Glycomyces sp. YM15]
MDPTETHDDELDMREATVRLDQTITRMQNDGRRVYLTRDGRRVAALVPVDEAELLDRLEDHSLARSAESAKAAQGDRPWTTSERSSPLNTAKQSERTRATKGFARLGCEWL